MRASMSIRAHLFLLTLCAVLPVLGFAAYVSSLIVQQDRDSIQRGAMDRTGALLTAVEADLRGSIASLQALATSEALDRGDLRAFQAEAKRVLESQADWLNITLSLPSGAQVVNALAPVGVPLPNVADPESAAKVVRTRLPAVGNVIVGPVVKSPNVPVRVPVVRDGRIAYVLTAAMKPAVFETLIRRQNVPQGWVIGLVDGAGRFVARIPAREPGSVASEQFRAAVREAPKGWYRGTTVEGLDSFTAFYRSDVSGWSIGFAIPADFVETSARRSIRLLSLGALASVLLALLAASLMGRRIAGPLVALAAGARAIGQGHAADIATAGEVREIGIVAGALQEAGSAVRAQRERDEREKDELHGADRAKDQFIAMLSHEMRNPLAALSAAGQVLKRSDPSQDSNAAKARGVIERQVAHMTRLIEDLLDVNRVTMGKVTLVREPLDLADVAADLMRTWRDAGRFDGHTVEFASVPARVVADRARLEQIVSNLLDNALKFTPRGRRIAVEVRPEGGEAVLRVTDEGEGIASAEIHRIFGLFVQGPQAQDRHAGGLGVGLALVRRLAELHGGTAGATSAGRDRGCCFTVRLPADAKG